MALFLSLYKILKYNHIKIRYNIDIRKGDNMKLRKELEKLAENLFDMACGIEFSEAVATYYLARVFSMINPMQKKFLEENLVRITDESFRKVMGL